MISMNKATMFTALNMKVNTTTFSNKGDSITSKFTNNTLTSKTFARRHVVTRGYFSGSSTQANVQDLWPHDENTTMDQFGILVLPLETDFPLNEITLTAEYDDSAFYCFLPVGNGYQIIHEINDLTVGNPYVAVTGSAYVSNVEITVNGEVKAPWTVIAVINSFSLFFPTTVGKIVKLTAVQSNNVTDIVQDTFS